MGVAKLTSNILANNASHIRGINPLVAGSSEPVPIIVYDLPEPNNGYIL